MAFWVRILTSRCRRSRTVGLRIIKTAGEQPTYTGRSQAEFLGPFATEEEARIANNQVLFPDWTAPDSQVASSQEVVQS